MACNAFRSRHSLLIHVRLTHHYFTCGISVMVVLPRLPIRCTCTEPGQYPVTLQVHTLEGCVTTLVLTRNDLINVHPLPVSAFTLNPPTTDICHSEISFTDQS